MNFNTLLASLYENQIKLERFVCKIQFKISLNFK